MHSRKDLGLCITMGQGHLSKLCLLSCSHAAMICCDEI